MESPLLARRAYVRLVLHEAKLRPAADPMAHDAPPHDTAGSGQRDGGGGSTPSKELPATSRSLGGMAPSGSMGRERSSAPGPGPASAAAGTEARLEVWLRERRQGDGMGHETEGHMQQELHKGRHPRPGGLSNSTSTIANLSCCR